MIYRSVLILLFIAFFFNKHGKAQEQAQATLLAPEEISLPGYDELHPTFSPDGKKVYFVRRQDGGQFTIHVSKRTDDGWANPEIVSFAGQYADQEPSLSRDGQRLYFTSNRPVTEGGDPVVGRGTWMIRRLNNGWSEPEKLPWPVRVDKPDNFEGSRFWGEARGPMEDADGNLWFWAERPVTEGHTDIYRTRFSGGVWTEPENIGPPLNSELYETGVYLEDDYILFGRDEAMDGFGLGDIYISFRNDSGWGVPINLGPAVNTQDFEFSPRLSPDGQILYFSSTRPHPSGEGGMDIYQIRWPPLLRELKKRAHPE